MAFVLCRQDKGKIQLGKGRAAFFWGSIVHIKGLFRTRLEAIPEVAE